jgi:hypothetical protein
MEGFLSIRSGVILEAGFADQRTVSIRLKIEIMRMKPKYNPKEFLRECTWTTADGSLHFDMPKVAKFFGLSGRKAEDELAEMIKEAMKDSEVKINVVEDL